jgi:hypothetical protein
MVLPKNGSVPADFLGAKATLRPQIIAIFALPVVETSSIKNYMRFRSRDELSFGPPGSLVAFLIVIEYIVLVDNLSTLVSEVQEALGTNRDLSFRIWE